MKKTIIGILCAAMLLLSITPVLGESTAYQPGTYTSTVRGMGGEYEIAVTFSENRIESIDASDNHETLMLGTEAIRILSEQILEHQSLDLDAVSAATVSSYTFISGIQDCVKQAGGDVEALKQVEFKVDTYADKTHKADVIVVGGGLGGLATASTAAKNGADVILLEQRGFMGGHSVLAAGQLLLGGTKLQAELGIEDDADTFDAWMLELGKGEKDPVQTRMVADRSQDAYDFILEMTGNWDTENLYAVENTYRGHALLPNIGGVFSDMADKMVEMGVDVRYNTRVHDLIVNEKGEVIGVKATDYYGNETEYYGSSIVLASGGYAGNKEMLLEYWGDKYKNLVYGGLKGTDGALMLAAMELGADTVNLDNPHLDACADLNTGITITCVLPMIGGAIVVRQSTAQRIADEALGHAEVLAAEMLDIGDPYYLIIYDDTASEVNSSLTYKVSFYENAGLVQKYDSIEALAEAYELDVQALKTTIDDYNAAVRGDKEDEFGRTAFNKEISAPFYCAKVSNGVTTTTGGLKINEKMQVVNTLGTVIPNLYAVGEITGGFRINYIGGSSLSHAVVGGIVAGEQVTSK